MTTLRGHGVVLRPMQPSDIPRQREFFRDAELAELDSSSPEAYAAIDVDEFIHTRQAYDGDQLFFAMEVRGEYVGYGGLMNLNRPNKVYELGVVIGDRRYWNRGYGQEVVELLLEHGFCALDGRKIELTTHERNERALACFSTCGFTEEHRIHGATLFDGQFVDMIEMSITRVAWEYAAPNSTSR